ncbi:hypothetical protein HAHE_02550 [Haloferula helveola]|uniref:VWFA domain-containing protein n=1 Tax=Haloferula helveola TaxID=490095 RepID=A0ABN6GYH9_9BACT|nr:hypothetical protein HAHE_02550 [Haloferula helveola]
MSFTLFQHLHFSPTPLTLGIGIITLVAIGALCVLAWGRSPHKGRTGFLEALRFLIALVAVLLLWKPEWRTVLHPESKPSVAILTDASGSMTTLDAEVPADIDISRPIVTRTDWVEAVVTDELRASLAGDGSNELIERDIALPPEDKGQLAGTDLSEPILKLLEEQDNLRAVVLFSDGDFNLGQPPVVAAQKLLQRGVPLFTIPTGSGTRLPDLDLLSVTAPTYGIVGENVQIPFTIRSSLEREVRTVVRLRDKDGRERTKEVVLPPGESTYESILWKIENEGSNTLELTVPLADGERIETNNSRRFTLSGRPESIKVLVIESEPRWEYRYLRNALSRDPGVDLSCMLFHPTLGMGDGPDYIQEFPSEPEELARYDVVMIGDVGNNPGQLTEEQCDMIAGLVENQASGVVFLPGPKGNQRSLIETKLGELMPVVLDADQTGGIIDTIASPLELTGEGRGSLLTLLADTEEGNPDVWRSLPGFYWHSAVLKAKGGAEVLAVHANRRTNFGPTPIIVTGTAGNGKVLYMGIDSAWRWRRGVEDKYHYRFWGQVARWMSYQRNMAAGQRIRLYYSPERPNPGDTVTLNANAFDPNGAPLEEGRVVVDATLPDGSSQRVSLEKNESAWGSFSGRLRITQPGEWKLAAKIGGDEGEAVETTLLAQGVELEKVGQPARPEVLEEMARIARGRMIEPAQLADLIREIEALPEPRPIENRLPLWTQWVTIAVVVLLLSIFWTGRKLNGTF